ncbi:MAG: hypothetical protein WCF67_16445 [Chitinophagaceae bacterium]
MKTLLTTLFIFSVAFAQAQTDSAQSSPQPFPDVPAFELLSLDSATFITKKDLKSQPLLLMYFSPDCDHCQHQVEDMIKNMTLFSNIQIILATHQPFENMKGFYEKYKLSQYPNIRIGRDTKFFLPPIFRMRNLPYLALYDKEGIQLTKFDGNATIEQLKKAFGL